MLRKPKQENQNGYLGHPTRNSRTQKTQLNGVLRIQVAKARLRPGEDSQLRSSLRALEQQRQAAEQYAAARDSLVGDGSSGPAGGLVGMLRQLDSQLRAVLAREEAAAAAAAAGWWPLTQLNWTELGDTVL
jgi:DNA repair ATPase RecN